MRLNRYKSIFTEKDHRKTLTKLLHVDKLDGGSNKVKINHVINDLHNIGGKYSLIFYNWLIDSIDPTGKFLRSFNDKTATSDDIALHHQMMYNKMYHDSETFTVAMHYILDWMKGRDRNPNPDEPSKIDYKRLSFAQAKQYATDWHTYLAKNAIDIELDTGNLFKKYSDGYYWVHIDKKFCDKEAEAMGHCGQSMYRDGNLYSLRTPRGQARVTIDVSPSAKAIGQIKGRGNDKPKEKYHPYIADFLINPPYVFKLNHLDGSGGDFVVSDLADTSLQKKIIKKNPVFLNAKMAYSLAKAGDKDGLDYLLNKLHYADAYTAIKGKSIVIKDLWGNIGDFFTNVDFEDNYEWGDWVYSVNDSYVMEWLSLLDTKSINLIEDTFPDIDIDDRNTWTSDQEDRILSALRGGAADASVNATENEILTNIKNALPGELKNGDLIISDVIGLIEDAEYRSGEDVERIFDYYEYNIFNVINFSIHGVSGGLPMNWSGDDPWDEDYFNEMFRERFMDY